MRPRSDVHAACNPAISPYIHRVNPFRVLQFNMQFGQVWDDADPDHAPVKIEATIEEIRRHSADIILLQEVEHARPAGVQDGSAPNYERLRAALSGYDSWFAYPKPDPRELPFGIGLAIFSRTPLHDTFAEDIPSPPIQFDFFGEPKTPTDRLLIGAKTELDGRSLRLLNTHLLAFFMLKTDADAHPEGHAVVPVELRDPQRVALERACTACA